MNNQNPPEEHPEGVFVVWIPKHSAKARIEFLKVALTAPVTTRSWCQPLSTERPPQLNRCSCLHLPPGQAKGGGFTAWVFQGSQTQANGGKDLGECFSCFSHSLRKPRRCDSGFCSVAK